MPPTRSVTAAPGTPLREYWEQETCGTHYIDAEKYTREYFDSIEAHRYKLEPFIHQFAEFSRWKGQRGLEVGVGAGTDFMNFVRAGADMTGVDLTANAVEHVKRRAEVYGFPPPDVRQLNAVQLPFDAATFDFVYSFGVIMHCADDAERVFDEIYRVTKPGGTIKITVYNLNATATWLKWMHHALVERKFLGPTAGRRWALANFQESGGTRGYTERSVRAWMSWYPHTSLRFRFDDDLVQPGDRWEHFWRTLRAVEPRKMRWFLSFELVKA